MHVLVTSAVVAAAAVATTVGSVPAAAAASGTASPVTPAASVQPAARCHYTIVGTNVNVRSGPGIRYRSVRVKQNGDPVTGPAPCKATVHADGYWWVELYLGSGGYGWVAEPYVHYVSYS